MKRLMRRKANVNDWTDHNKYVGEILDAIEGGEPQTVYDKQGKAYLAFMKNSIYFLRNLSGTPQDLKDKIQDVIDKDRFGRTDVSYTYPLLVEELKNFGYQTL